MMKLASLTSLVVLAGCVAPDLDSSEHAVMLDGQPTPMPDSMPAPAPDASGPGPCVAIGWTADDIAEDYYPWQPTFDHDGEYMGENAPYTLGVGSPGMVVEVAPPEDDVAWQQGVEWDIRLAATGACELVFHRAGPYTIRVGGEVSIAAAAAAALADGAPVRMRRARRGDGMVPGDTDLSLYSDSGGGPGGIGMFAVPLGRFALPQPRHEVADAAAAIVQIAARRAQLGRPIVVAFLAHGNVGRIALEDETITTANAFDKFFGGRGDVEHQRQLSCLSGTPATPQVLERTADAYSGAMVATVGGWDALIIATPAGFFTTGTYHEYHGE